MRVKWSREIMGLVLAMVIGASLYCPSPLRPSRSRFGSDMEASSVRILTCDVVLLVSKPPRCVTQGCWSEPFKFQDDLLILVRCMSGSWVRAIERVLHPTLFTTAVLSLGIDLRTVSTLSSGRLDQVEQQGVLHPTSLTAAFPLVLGRYRRYRVAELIG
ncbi:hypothetical protein QCA50_005259 [Cerrena zonata]|uniref:Uncharacterized protein n=1 Tax=Cerrena zonata TaxID=2478898 RepID=A0AAW0GRI0_9APHY